MIVTSLSQLDGVDWLQTIELIVYFVRTSRVLFPVLADLVRAIYQSNFIVRLVKDDFVQIDQFDDLLDDLGLEVSIHLNFQNHIIQLGYLKNRRVKSGLTVPKSLFHSVGQCVQF